MQGTISSFRRSRRVQKTSHIIVHVSSIDNREKASKLIGKNAVWKSPAGKEINGKVASPHGNKGALRIIFEKGLPGQSMSDKVEIN